MKLLETAAYLATLGMIGCSSEIIDMTYVFDENVPSFPILTRFKLKVVKKGEDKYGQWYESNDFCTSEHVGTHLDAPVHFARNKWATQDIPLERLYKLPGIVIDVSREAEKMQNYAVRPRDMEKWEAEHGVIPDGAVVLLRTGWGLKATTDPAAYSGLDRNEKTNFPGLNSSTAEWVVNHKEKHGHSTGIVGVGIDTMSIDVGQAFIFDAHRILMESNIYVLENVANLHLLPPKGFLLTALPMKIGGGSGAPARIVAEVGAPDESCSGASSIRMRPTEAVFFILIIAAKFFLS